MSFTPHLNQFVSETIEQGFIRIGQIPEQLTDNIASKRPPSADPMLGIYDSAAYQLNCDLLADWREELRRELVAETLELFTSCLAEITPESVRQLIRKQSNAVELQSVSNNGKGRSNGHPAQQRTTKSSGSSGTLEARTLIAFLDQNGFQKRASQNGKLKYANDQGVVTLPSSGKLSGPVAHGILKRVGGLLGRKLRLVGGRIEIKEAAAA